MKTYSFEAKIEKSDAGKGGAFVRFPYDVRKEFGKGRIKVHATFDEVPYSGSIVNMGVKNADGSICYILIQIENSLVFNLNTSYARPLLKMSIAHFQVERLYNRNSQGHSRGNCQRYR